MLTEKFTHTAKTWWHEYLKKIWNAHQKNELHIGGDLLLYPSMLLIIQAPGFLAIELTGATPTYKGLTLKIHKTSSIQTFFNQFEIENPNPACLLDSSNNTLTALAITANVDPRDSTTRFPDLGRYKSFIIGTAANCSIDFGPNFKSCCFSQTSLVNRSGNLHRCKFILHSQIFKNPTSRAEVIRAFEDQTRDGIVQGVATVLNDQYTAAIAGQFQSMYLTPNLRETTLGEFLRLHPEIIKKALDCEEFHTELTLPWLEYDDDCKDESIRPDLIIKRKDGSWDIYDLKTALLDQNKITKSEFKRRGFLACVDDGLSQLAHYRTYFQYAKNAAYAQERFGVTVTSPRLTLIIGSWENVDTSQVKQALRKYDASIEVLDYDSFIQRFLASIQPSFGADAS